MKNHAAATTRNRIFKGAALCGVLALSMTLTGCFVPPDDLSGDLSNQGVVYNTVAVTAPQRTATPTPSPTPTVESVFNFGTNTIMPTTQPGVITSNGIVTVVTTPPGSVATTARPTATPTPTAAAVLKKGSSGADVKTLQRRLKQLGYYTGSVDGDFGDATEKALRAFQDRNNLLVDGIAGKSTMAKLNSSNAVKAAAATATPRKTATPKPKTTATPNLSTEYYLQSGSSGTRVRTLQARLIELGWMAGSPDGNYEGATEYAVKAFQKKYKSLYTDGVAGPSTLQTLYSSSAAKSSTPVSSIGTTLESGMKNSGAVKAMQTRLKSLGYHDQRLLNDMLPDEENSKASTCVEKAYKIWENTKEQKSAQLIFCDLSTPKGDGTFNVYEDIKNKLMEKGVPENEIAFIHDANTELRKAELFAKVRSGQVRFLLGSTAKMGAGTNVQDRLIALHHLDVPWRPSDIEQQEGRILRQGNQNDKVKIFRYVTEGTFDSYSWQLIENKQKFIGQIMTSKSPVRSCEDVDEAALSYAEVKALATGNPYIKEKMDLDIQVSKLKLMKANHTSQKYRLEDNITQHYPHQIAIFKERIEGFTADMNKYAKNKPEDKEQFFMQVGGKSYTDKKEAGTAIIAMCKEIKGINASADVGEYLGFKLNVTFDSFNNKFVMNVKGAMSHPMEVGSDPLGNITRINNVLEAMPSQLEEAQMKLSNVKHQLETAKAEVDKPFPQEAELAEKLERLAELNSLLNMDEKGDDAIGMDDEATEPEKPQEDVKKVDNREEVVADMPIKQSNLEKAAPEGERRLADRPAERTSLQEKLAAMKARVSGTPAGRDAVDKAKGKDQIL